MSETTISIRLLSGDVYNIGCGQKDTFRDIGQILTRNQLAQVPVFAMNGVYITHDTCITQVDQIGPIAVFEMTDCLIKLQSLSGLRVRLYVNPDTTYANIKTMIVHMGITSCTQNIKIILCGKIIPDNETIKSTEVIYNTILHFVIRLEQV